MNAQKEGQDLGGGVGTPIDLEEGTRSRSSAQTRARSTSAEHSREAASVVSTNNEALISFIAIAMMGDFGREGIELDRTGLGSPDAHSVSSHPDDPVIPIAHNGQSAPIESRASIIGLQ